MAVHSRGDHGPLKEKMEVQTMGVSIELSEKAAYLAWEDLTVVLPNLREGERRKILSGLSGYAQLGRTMAIMGPSGSGKSTLLDSLAGRLSESVIMTGNVLVNGKKRSTNCRDISYVTQEDVFLGTLTVRETITYSSLLRLPTKLTKDDINEVVEKAIMEMGLQDCADSKIGNWHFRGISNGEKKRLSICLEIITHPHVLFLDEPTTGLDSASAFFVIRALRNIAQDGRVVVSSIHQPSSDVFDLFDDLLLLTSGETVYFGEAHMAVKFFSDTGFPCPIRRNPSDHFLRCVTTDFDTITATLLRSQKNCEELVIESNNGSHASWWKQLCTLTCRSFLNMSRDMGYYWIRIVFYVLVAITVGTINFDIGETNWAILARGKCGAFIYGFMICLSVGGLPFFIEELKVFDRERSNGHYGEAVFALSNFLSSFPFLVMTSLSSGTIIYYMVKFHPGFSHYSYFCLNLFCCIAIIESCMMVVAILVPTLLMGVGTGTGVIVFMMLASEISRSLPDLPRIFWRYPMSYISFASWAIQGQYKNDMIGLEFDPLVPGDPKLKGEIILQKMYGIELNYSKWWDLTALMFLYLCHRGLLFIVLKYKKKASSLLRKLYAKRTLQHFDRRSQLKREKFISSKRRQPLHPLSSQEGVGSPIA